MAAVSTETADVSAETTLPPPAAAAGAASGARYLDPGKQLAAAITRTAAASVSYFIACSRRARRELLRLAFCGRDGPALGFGSRSGFGGRSGFGSGRGFAGSLAALACAATLTTLALG